MPSSGCVEAQYNIGLQSLEVMHHSLLNMREPVKALWAAEMIDSEE